MKRILVPGGAGYIGSHMVYALIENGYEAIVVDNLETGHAAAIHPKAAFWRGDIRDSGFVAQLLSKERIDGVIHFAASSLVGESMQKPLAYYDNNLHGTQVLLQGMLQFGVKHIVFSSTAATYGEPERIPILEEDRTLPTNTYGDTKLAVERMLHWAAQAHGLQYAALRYFNACGAHSSGRIGEAHSPETHLIPLLLQVAQGKRPGIQIFGDDYNTPDGTCIRDYVHVEDLAQAHILALEYLLSGNESDIFNLGNGVGFSVRQVLAAAEQVVGQTIVHNIAPRRAGDPERLVASSEKALQVLGWQPQYSALDTIVRSAWRWHSGHPNGYEG